MCKLLISVAAIGNPHLAATVYPQHAFEYFSAHLEHATNLLQLQCSILQRLAHSSPSRSQDTAVRCLSSLTLCVILGLPCGSEIHRLFYSPTSRFSLHVLGWTRVYARYSTLAVRSRSRRIKSSSPTPIRMRRPSKQLKSKTSAPHPDESMRRFTLRLTEETFRAIVVMADGHRSQTNRGISPLTLIIIKAYTLPQYDRNTCAGRSSANLHLVQIVPAVPRQACPRIWSTAKESLVWASATLPRRHHPISDAAIEISPNSLE